MKAHSDNLVEFLRRYALAVCCIVAPIVLALGTFSLAEQILIPSTLHSENSDGTLNADRLTFNYLPAQADEALGEPPIAAGAKSAATAAPSAVAPKRIAPDALMFLPAINYAARNSFAIASGFLFIASLITLIYASALLYLKWQWRGVAGAFAIWCGVALAITYAVSNPHGRYLVVLDLLNAADSFPRLEKFSITLFGRKLATGTVADDMVHFNTIVSLIPVGLLLTALMAISIRDAGSKTLESLKSRLMALRCALLLGSTVFVIGVLSNKALVEWPLQLVRVSQAKALRPIADSLVLQFGALGTTALFAAFTPAIVAWMLDVAAMMRDAAANPKAKAATKAKPSAKIGLGRGASTNEDGLIFAPLSTVTAIIAVLAPVLASPIVDSLKSLVGAMAK
jgi:hypothetical protein